MMGKGDRISSYEARETQQTISRSESGVEATPRGISDRPNHVQIEDSVRNLMHAVRELRALRLELSGEPLPQQTDCDEDKVDTSSLVAVLEATPTVIQSAIQSIYAEISEIKCVLY